MRKGFTLIELLVVITIISILTVVLLTQVIHGPRQAKLLGCKTRLTHINTALLQYAAEPPMVFPYPGDKGVGPDPVGSDFLVRLYNSGKISSSDDTIKGVKILKCPFAETKSPSYAGPLYDINDPAIYKKNDPIIGDIVFNSIENYHESDVTKEGIHALLKSGEVVIIRKGESNWDAYNKLVGTGLTQEIK